MPQVSKFVLAVAIFVSLGLFGVIPAQADQVVYTNNFTTASTAPGVTASLTGGVTVTSPNNTQTFREFFNNDPTVELTLSGLASSSSVTLTFNLYAIQSLDGNGEFCCTDSFNVTANGVRVFDQTFANFEGGNTQSYNGTTNTGGNAPRTGAMANNTLGYSFFGDATYLLTVTAMTDAAGSITFNFNGVDLQGRGDESFGIDNLNVRGTGAEAPTAVPEPATVILLGTGLAGVTGAARKRRKARANEAE